MQLISNLTVFTGTIPDKATQTDNEFANNVFGFINYTGIPFVTDVNTIVNQLNILSDQINIAATQTATNAQNAVNATATLVAGSIDDVVISGTKAYSNQKINALFDAREDKLGTNIASATSITIGTAGLGDTIHITGTTTITSLGVASVIGTRRTLIFDGALTLTHNGTFLICPNATNITTVAGTVVEVVADNTTVWRVLCVSHPSLSFAKMGYLSTITSDVQAQLNLKAPLLNPVFSGSISSKDLTYKNAPVAITSWSYATTAITLNVASHTFIVGDYIEVSGLTATTYPPNGIWLVTQVTSTTIVFSSATPPTGTAGVSSAIAKGYATINGRVLESIGVNQTWQDMTANRVSGTNYINTTGKPIMILIAWKGTVNNSITATINGLTTSELGGTYNLNTVYVNDGISIIVPNGQTYLITNTGGTIAKWLELR